MWFSQTRCGATPQHCKSPDHEFGSSVWFCVLATFFVSRNPGWNGISIHEFTPTTCCLGHRLNARCRGGASPFVFCGAGSGTAKKYPLGKGAKLTPKMVFWWYFIPTKDDHFVCPFEPWPYLVFRYPVASWCISIYGENKECSYRVYVFTYIYTYSWESTTI